MSWSLISHRVDGLGVNGGTTGTINTTGCDFLALVVSSNGGGPVLVGDISDSASNTWLANPPSISNFSPGLNSDANQIFYAKNASGSATHTATISRTGGLVSCDFSAWSGSHLTAPYNAESNDHWFGSNLTSFQQALGLTPSEDNCLIIAGLQIYVSATGHTISGNSFALLDTIPLGAGSYYGTAAGYVIQGTLASANPTWSWTNQTSRGSTTMAAFKAAASTSTVKQLAALGVG